MDAQEKEDNPTFIYFSAVLLALMVVGGVYFGYQHRMLAPKRLEAHTRTWYESPRMTALVMFERYGPPSVLVPQIATWYGKAPWTRVTVHGNSPDKYLEQTVGYQAKPSAVAPLREFGQGVRYDLIREELSASSRSEALNFLALNLAHEVATGKRSPAQARNFYARTEKLQAAGKSSPYLQKLLFEPYLFRPQDRMINLVGY